MKREVYKTKNAEEGYFPDEVDVVLRWKPRKDEKTGTVTEGRTVTIPYALLEDLRYSINPHQRASTYGIIDRPSPLEFELLKTGKQGLSETNVDDIDRGLRLMRLIGKEEPAVTIHKHINPCGAAKSKTLKDALERAYWADRRAAFGGTIVLNGEVNEEIADYIMETDVFENVAAPAYTQGAVAEFKNKEKHKRNNDIRVVLYEWDLLKFFPTFKGEKGMDIRTRGDGTLNLSDPYTTSLAELTPAELKDEEGNLVARSYREVTPQEADDLRFAWKLCAHTRSNAILFVKDGAAVSIGTGQQERVGAIEQAVRKAYQKTEDMLRGRLKMTTNIGYELDVRKGGLKGAVIASDGFMSSVDNIEAIREHGVTAIIQPGGSVKDKAVLELANKYEIAMVFAPERCFSHF